MKADPSGAFEIFDFQNESEWLSGRMNGIGGSDASAILGLNPFKTNVQLFDEKTGRSSPEDISDKPCIIYGKYAEDPIRELFKLDFPEYQVFHHPFRILRSIKYPFMQASLDGELIDPDGRKGVLEIKTTTVFNGSQYREKWDHKIPDNYYIQVLHYLIVTGYEFAILKAHINADWGGEKTTNVRHYFIEKSEVLDDMKYLLDAEIKFNQQIINRQRPALILPDI